jgi:hypothetical protein
MHAARAASEGLDKGNDVAESKGQQNGQKKVLNEKKMYFLHSTILYY